MSTEHAHQVSVVQWFDATYPQYAGRLVASANGAYLVGRHRQARRLKAAGLAAGFPDLFLPVARGGRHGLMIEMKRPGGRVAPEQRAWQVWLRGHGYCAEICYGADDAIAAISAYLLS